MIEGISQSLSLSIHPVVGPSSAFGRSLLHKAVCDMDIEAVKSHMAGDYFERRDQKGFCPIHSACALCLKVSSASSVASDIVRILINAGADASIRDLDGNTPLHWAARAADKGTVELLLVKNNPKGEK
jgi:ankyrin repeat protein